MREPIVPTAMPSGSGPLLSERVSSKNGAPASAAIVGLLTRSQPHQSMTVSDIKRGLIAPIMLGQYILAGRSAAEGAGSPPVAVLIWAKVSDAVDQRLTAANSARIELASDEWNSGNIVWLTEAVGDLRLVPQMVARLRSADPTIQAIRVASSQGDGTIAVRTLDRQ